MQRRKFLVGTTLARSYIPRANTSGDVNRATEILGDLLPELSAMKSVRIRRHFNDTRQALMPFERVASVREFNARYRDESRGWGSDG
jgi:hypothetical protein